MSDKTAVAIKALEAQSKKHYDLGVQERAIKKERSKIAAWCKAMLQKLGAQDHFWKTGGVQYQAMKYAQETVEWDIKALRALGVKKRADLTMTAADVSAIQAAVASGKITVEELRECGKVSRDWRFKVLPVKESHE
jgi:hypothetical protein